MNRKNCIQEILLSAYLDGELAGDALKDVEFHLPGCPDCSAAYERMKAGRDLLLECLPNAEPPAALKPQLFQKIDAAPEILGQSGIMPWTRISQVLPLRSRAWAVACASVVFCAVMISAFHLQRRLEYTRMLADIDRSRAEWVARELAPNPFEIVTRGAQSPVTEANPFKSYLNEH